LNKFYVQLIKCGWSCLINHPVCVYTSLEYYSIFITEFGQLDADYCFAVGTVYNDLTAFVVNSAIVAELGIWWNDDAIMRTVIFINWKSFHEKVHHLSYFFFLICMLMINKLSCVFYGSFYKKNMSIISVLRKITVQD